MVPEELIRWFAAATGICAATIVASDLGRRATGVGFVVFTVSSLVWIFAGYLEDLPSLMAQNAVLTVINCVGIYRWLFLKGSIK